MRASRLLSAGTRALRSSLGGARGLHLNASSASITDAIAHEKVLVFSKTHCPFCTRVKATLDVLETKYAVVELDTRDDGDEIQALLFGLTGQRTVPNVFINGKHVGGCDDVLDLHARNELVPLLGQEQV
ncbi:unnamed protein product [Hyaloperonospora brassicae]|uniref:Glutaredoxin domain-containing protein n=1 Tax=Hyaloperonospora brassicae TaxID=162125 RepID=A0AAV0V4B8_HYABA|nr:unnamed protein product [Hyaloperonospora brassicae]